MNRLLDGFDMNKHTYIASNLADPSLYWISVELLFRLAHLVSSS